MDVHVADHPLIAHKLTYLRDERTDSPTFRRLAEELVMLLAYEATRDVQTEPFEIRTPVAPTTGIKLSNPKPIIVPILRAGLGMLEGMVRLLPSAEVGFLGMVRNEETLEVTTYANRLPERLDGRQVYVRQAVERVDVPVKIVLGAIDERLNEHGYIVPGLGDAGDRLYGVV